MPDLLIELFSEEIPARMQARAAADLRRLVTDHMVEAGLTYAAAQAFAGPRRLTLALTGLPEQTMATREERKGPRADAPDKAIEGFLRSTGLTRDRLEVRADKKGDVLFAVIDRPGRPAADVVAEAVETAVRGFPWPKSMRWGSGTLRWVRPLRRILCLLHDETESTVVPLSIEGIAAGDLTEGHRVHAPGPFQVRSFDHYAEVLAGAHVVLDPEARKSRIHNDATQAAFALGLDLIEDPALLDEVAGLVEWPVVLTGPIEERFLALPPEVLQTSMREHQKFFSLRNPATGRIERFATVANLEAPDGGATILAGNQRVLAARLADAAFFWENDLRVVRDRGLEAWEIALGRVTFHEKIGTLRNRMYSIERLALSAADSTAAPKDQVRKAAHIVKTDLASEMVYEFPELQGVMGRHYATAAGLDAAVAEACETHYLPIRPGDPVPNEPLAMTLALADRLSMLTAFWAIDERPTGSGDPFALRRAALGAIRILLENGVRLPLLPTLAEGVMDQFLASGVPARIAADVAQTVAPEKRAKVDQALDRDFPRAEVRAAVRMIATDLLGFFADRLKVALRDQGIRHDVIQACFDLGGQDDLVLLVARVRAVQDLLATDDGANLLVAYRRAANIVAAERRKEPDGDFAAEPDAALAVEPAERALFDAVAAVAPRIETALAAEDFAAAAAAMAELRAPVDTFFDLVTVNASDPAQRLNRLRLLSALSRAMDRVALWSAIEG
ncbi:MAG: glycine--tRNA ligase subunit beta [Pseudomonadota bacterium]